MQGEITVLLTCERTDTGLARPDADLRDVWEQLHAIDGLGTVDLHWGTLTSGGSPIITIDTVELDVKSIGPIVEKIQEIEGVFDVR